MSNIPELNNIPDISFIDGKTLAGVEAELIGDYLARYSELTGKTATLAPADPIRLVLMSVADLIYQGYRYIDRAGKQNLMKWSYDEFLDSLASFKHLTRRPAQPAVTTLRFSVVSARASATAIPAGTRAATESGVRFATDAYAEIAVGELYIDVAATALVPGVSGNGFAAGAVNLFVDPVPYVDAVSNTTASAGGADIETDDELTERIYYAPAGYSVAGPEDAYESFAKQFRADIGDVSAMSPAPSRVSVYFMLDGGVAPSAQDILDMYAYLSDKNLRPLGDRLTVAAPVDVDYSIALTYYISAGKSTQAAAIQTAVNAAILEYKEWQRHIGRDINPSKLVSLIMAAGAKRVEVTSPIFTIVSGGSDENQKFDGDGTTKVFTVTKAPPVLCSVTISGEETTAYGYNPATGVITFVTAPASGTENIEVKFRMAYIPALSAESVTYGGLEDD